ncbi:hypothetical protein EG831_01845 [bacterium]|nr:hypothetical protein [bacterium]
MPRRLALLALAILITATSSPLLAGPLRDRIKERTEQRGEAGNLDDLGDGDALSCAEWSRKLSRLERLSRNRQNGPAPERKNVAYGSTERETLDVYLPKAPPDTTSPIILMVHGGGWCVGDKAARGVAKNGYPISMIETG